MAAREIPHEILIETDTPGTDTQVPGSGTEVRDALSGAGQAFPETMMETPEVLRAAVRTALAAEGMDFPCEVDILLTDNTGIHALNRAYRNVDAPTDVLSFPAWDARPGPEDADPETGLVPLGDMALSVERAAAQAREYGHSVQRELAYLTVHSVLHLLGYDHVDEGPEKARMRAREEAILREMGLQREGPESH